MFRCCLPCRGGSAAPATSPPSSPSPTSDEQYTNLTVDEPLTSQSSSNIRLSQTQSQTQTSSQSQNNQQQSPLPHIEEEEEADNNQRKSEEDLSVKDNFLLICGGVGAGTSGSGNTKSKLKERFIGEVNSPSPRTKINRKQSKGRTRPITSSSDTTGSGSGGGILTGVINNVTSIIPAGLLPKMQAEQGSIGDLQKYHTRYLKNRRHTLANVR